MQDWIETTYRKESRRVLATLIRLLGDFDLAEEALHEAFASALAQWPRDGVPDNPTAWLVSAGRFKAIDQIRRRSRYDSKVAELAREQEPEASPEDCLADAHLEDDQLRLIFTCCHPSLAVDAQVALTLREVCGLRTEEVARAFLLRPATVAQRIVRAKAKIRQAGIPYEVPEIDELPARLGAVLHVIYLVFSEGYSASEGDAVTRPEFAQEALYLVRLLANLLPNSEIRGLLALMLLQDSRRNARTDANGDLVLLEDQNHDLWDWQQIDEGLSLIRELLTQGAVGPYTLQAAIAAVHAEAPRIGHTDWTRIVRLYDLLLRTTPSPVVALNRAVALSMRDGPRAGLDAVEALIDRGELVEYHLTHAARADFYRRLGHTAEARLAYEQALSLTKQEPERRFLQRRLDELK
ncbi:MAG: RNA polymerase sigma factor [Saccharospirillum sp.]|nr:RNA polymerase sigma factor [Saccharospirillum sp.]